MFEYNLNPNVRTQKSYKIHFTFFAILLSLLILLSIPFYLKPKNIIDIEEFFYSIDLKEITLNSDIDSYQTVQNINQYIYKKYFRVTIEFSKMTSRKKYLILYLKQASKRIAHREFRLEQISYENEFLSTESLPPLYKVPQQNMQTREDEIYREQLERSVHELKQLLQESKYKIKIQFENYKKNKQYNKNFEKELREFIESYKLCTFEIENSYLPIILNHQQKQEIKCILWLYSKKETINQNAFQEQIDKLQKCQNYISEDLLRSAIGLEIKQAINMLLESK